MLPIVTSAAASFIPVLWHGTRTIGRILLVLLIVGWLISPPLTYKYGRWKGIGIGKNEGYKAGYAQAIKDNPSQQYGDNATVTNIQDGLRSIFDLGVWKIRFGAYLKR